MARPLVTTETVRRQWKGGGACLIDGDAVPLAEVLAGCVPVDDPRDYLQRPRNGAFLIEHPLVPRVGFLVRSDGLRDVVIAIMGKVKHKMSDWVVPAPDTPLDTEFRRLERRVAALERELAETEVVE